jgi:ribulose-phosphate 3-epimerase
VSALRVGVANRTQAQSTPAGRTPSSQAQVLPSILAADFSRLGAQVREVLDAGARAIHCDVMDGHFVPPVTFGPIVVSALSELVHGAGATLDVHLMVERPERLIGDFASAGADTISVHYEATPHVHYALASVREAGCRAGLALNPATAADLAAPVGELLDVALCMTVNPGWGGQRLIAATLPKIARLREMLGPGCDVEVDGGVEEASAPECARRGANLLVAGSAIFGSAEPGAAYQRIAGAVGER